MNGLSLVIAVAALIIASTAIWVAGSAHGQADEQEAMLGPVVQSWWMVHCFAAKPGPGQTRGDYDSCITVYRWLVDNGVGPFQEAK